MLKTIRIFNLVLISFDSFSCTKEDQQKSKEVFITDSVKATDPNESTKASNLAKHDTLKFSQFSGAWFNIEYPSNFKAENSMRSFTHSDRIFFPIREFLNWKARLIKFLGYNTPQNRIWKNTEKHIFTSKGP